ncbi:unnamed protein product [Sphagnum balticum]
MGGGDLTYYRSRSNIGGRVERYCVSSARRSEEFGGNVTTDAIDGLQFLPDSSASQSQNPAGSSVGAEELRAEELCAEELSRLVKEQIGRLTKEEKEKLGTLLKEKPGRLGPPIPDSDVVEEVPKFPGQAKGLAPLIPWSCLHDMHDFYGNLAESSDAPHAKRTKLAGSKNFQGVRKRNNAFCAEIRPPGMKNKIWLGTYKTAEAAAQARGAAANWLATRSGSKLLNDEERDELKKCAKKAGEHLSDYRSHHNVALPDLVENLEEKATALASLMGNAVASAEHVSQRGSPAHENLFSSSEFLDWESLLDL